MLTAAHSDVKVLAVPVQALRYEDNPDKSSKADKSLASVFVYADGRATKRTVTTGTADDSYIAVTSGLKEGEQVVIGPAKTLLFLLDRDKLHVKAKDEPAAKPDAKPAQKK